MSSSSSQSQPEAATSSSSHKQSKHVKRMSNIFPQYLVPGSSASSQEPNRQQHKNSGKHGGDGEKEGMTQEAPHVHELGSGRAIPVSTTAISTL